MRAFHTVFVRSEDRGTCHAFIWLCIGCIFLSRAVAYVCRCRRTVDDPIRESPDRKRRDRPSQPRSRSTERTMTKTILTVATVLTIGIAAPAFAEGNAKASPWDSPNSLPPGFFDGTVQQMQVQIRDNWFASQQAQQHLANQPAKQVNPTSSQPHG